MANKTKAELEAENAKLRADLAIAADMFNEAAEEADLCEVYDETIAEVNKKLTSDFRFSPRGEEHELRIDLTASIGPKTNILARSYYDAEQKLRDMSGREVWALVGHGELYDALKNAGFSPDWE